jgi:hypothetical protein
VKWLKNVLALILACGKGERLHLLMLHRAKPSGTTIGYDVKSGMERFHVSEGGVAVLPKGAR